MKRILIVVAVLAIMIACQQRKYGAFTVSGKITNAPEQKIYLQEIPFGGENPVIVDSGTLKKGGTFELRSMAKEEGLYRLTLEKGGEILLVNDANGIRVNADVFKFREYKVEGSAASQSIHELFETYLKHAEVIASTGGAIDTVAPKPGNDSLVTVLRLQRSREIEKLKDEVKEFITTSNSPAAIYFAIGRFAVQMFSAEEVIAMVNTAANAHKEHTGLAKLKSLMALQQQQKPAENDFALLNQQAPEIKLPTPGGSELALSSFKGKYVLVDFWASWCAPCRAENPNVVAVYNKYKDKNFTILGVTLDQDKAQWTKAITKDQ